MDVKGKTAEPVKLKNAKLIVFVAAGTKCPIVRQNIPTLNELALKWKKRNVRFFLVNSAAQDTSANFRIEFPGYGANFPALFDEQQRLARELGFYVTSQAVVYSVKDKKVLYSGPIDDQYSADGRRSPSAGLRKNYLDDALAAVEKNAPVVAAGLQAFGCAITLRE